MSFVCITYYTHFEILLVCTKRSTVMSKFYLSEAAKREARQERETKAAKMPKISKFLKPADSAPKNTLDLVIQVRYDQCSNGRNGYQQSK